MKKLGMLLLFFMPLCIPAFSSQSYASEAHSPKISDYNQEWLTPNHHEFMTIIDRVGGTLSNLSIQNIGNEDTVTGLYLFVLALGSGDTCGAPLIESESSPLGALWAPKVTMATNETKSIGANYLYNMIMLFMYQAFLDGHGGPYTPGYYLDNAQVFNTYCLWLGVTNQVVGTGTLTCSSCGITLENTLVQYIAGDLPISFTNVTCNDSTRLCSTSDVIQPQPFPHQRP